jgi:competence protein ComEC
MVLGDASQLTHADRRAFARSGLLHWFSVSGLHAGIVAAMFYGLFIVFGLPPRARSAATVAGVIVFAALAGFSLPVARTVIMVAALGAEAWLRRPSDSRSRLRRRLGDPDPLAALAVSDFVSTILPGRAGHHRLSASDQGIRAASRRGRSWVAGSHLEGIRGPGTRIGAVCRASGGASPRAGACLPADFGRCAGGEPDRHAVCDAVSGPGRRAGWAGILAPGLGALLDPAVRALVEITMAIARGCGAPSWSATPIAPFPGLWMAAWYALLFGGAHVRSGSGPGHAARRRAAVFVHGLALAALAVWMSVFSANLAAHGRLRVTFIDVGQGDSILVELPGGQVLLVDGGPAWPPNGAQFNIEPVLRSRGIDRIDLFAATHGDADHIGGFADILDSFRVMTIAHPPGVETARIWGGVAARIPAEGAKEWVLHEGARNPHRPKFR